MGYLPTEAVVKIKTPIMETWGQRYFIVGCTSKSGKNFDQELPWQSFHDINVGDEIRFEGNQFSFKREVKQS